MLELKNKSVLITGATHGIGLEILKKLTENKCKIVFFSKNKSRVKKTNLYLKKNKIKYYSETLDVLNLKEVENFLKNIKKNFSGIDILINNVGGGGTEGNDLIEDTEFKVWTDVMQKNAMIAARLIKHCIPNMKKKWGRVITISSVSTKKFYGKACF